MTQAPSVFISIDGPDGAGKSTLIEELARRLGHRFILLRRSSETGFVPMNVAERVNYFRTTDPFLAARAYIGAHMARFSDARLVAKRLHWRAQMVPRAEGSVVVVADRGPHSVLAYAWATVCMDGTIDADVAWEWVLLQAKLLGSVPIDLELLLVPSVINGDTARRLLARTRTPPHDEFREARLIDLQLQALQRRAPFCWPSVTIDPFQPNADVISAAVRELDPYVTSPLSSIATHRVQLSDVLSIVRSVMRPGFFRGRVWLCRGIVEKGYTDNDIDVIAEWPEDVASLSVLLHNMDVHHHYTSLDAETWVLALPNMT